MRKKKAVGFFSKGKGKDRKVHPITEPQGINISHSRFVHPSRDEAYQRHITSEREPQIPVPPGETPPDMPSDMPSKSMPKDAVTTNYLEKYSQIQGGDAALANDVTVRYMRNKDKLSKEDKRDIKRHMIMMRPMFPFGVPKLMQDIAVAYPPSELRGEKRG